MRRIRLSGHPRPAPRPRGRGGQSYNPKWYTALKQRWAAEAKLQVDEPYAPDVRLAVVLHFYRKDFVTADFDNLAKSVTDPLNGLAWHDDNQIDEAHIYIHRGVGEKNAHATVTVGRVGRVLKSPGLRAELRAAHVRDMARRTRAVTPQLTRVDGRRREAA